MPPHPASPSEDSLTQRERVEARLVERVEALDSAVSEEGLARNEALLSAGREVIGSSQMGV